MGGLKAVVVLATLLACVEGAKRCKIPVGDKHVFRALKADYEIKANQQTINFNLCREDHADEQCGHGKHGSFAVAKKLSKCYNLGGDGQKPEFSLIDENEPGKGYKVTITGGDRTAICPSGSQRSLEVVMNCDPTKHGYDFECHPDTCEEPKCHYSVQVHTYLACPPSGDDWGWNFVMWFCVVVAVYVIGGVGYNYQMRQLRGIEAFPNIEFWREMPGLIKDGCEFSKEQAMQLYNRVTAK